MQSYLGQRRKRTGMKNESTNTLQQPRKPPTVSTNKRKYMKTKIVEQIKDHCDKKKYTLLTRKVGKTSTESSRGYILNISNEFILLQETDDFKVLGYNIFPLKQIVSLRHDDNDEFYDKIIKAEKESKKIGIKYAVNLSSWMTIFHSIKSRKLNVIIECENPDNYSFDIGPISEIKKTSVCIQYMNGRGIIDKEPTNINFKLITKIMFDDRYINTLSKYSTKQEK